MNAAKKTVSRLWKDVCDATRQKKNESGVLLKGKYLSPALERRRRFYLLSGRYAHIYFTRREAQTMWLILQGCKVREAADQLGLSCRTVEFYVQSLRKKLHSPSKVKLIEMIIETDFQKNFQKYVYQLAI